MVLRGDYGRELCTTVPIVWIIVAIFGLPAFCHRAAGQHAGDIFLARDPGGQIVVGLEDEETESLTLGHRVFAGALGSDFVTTDPGFGALDAGDEAIPPGVFALPGDFPLGFNVVAFRPLDQPRSNLFVWDAHDPDVQFAPVPAGYTLQIEQLSGERVRADGTDQDVPGFDIVVTAPGGFVHEHLAFTVRDGDTSISTQPLQGTYLFGLELTMPGLKTSDPVLIALNTQDVGPTQASAAIEWLDANLDRFQFGVPLAAGDANQDLRFDQLDLVQVQVAAKYLTGQLATWGEGDWDGAPGGSPGSPPPGNGWFDQLDIVAALEAGKYLAGPYTAIANDGRRNDEHTSMVAKHLGAGDLTAARSLAGAADLGNLEQIHVPEPASLLLLGVGSLALMLATRKSRRAESLFMARPGSNGPTMRALEAYIYSQRKGVALDFGKH